MRQEGESFVVLFFVLSGSQLDDPISTEILPFGTLKCHPRNASTERMLVAEQ